MRGSLLVLALVAVAAGSIAYAAIPDPDGTIHGCYQRSNGNLRVVESAKECRPSENALSWNQQGPPGRGIRHLDRVVLQQDQRRVLFSAGPLTFTANCRRDHATVFPDVEVTTSQDHSAVYGGSYGPGDSDLNQNETGIIHFFGAQGTPQYTAEEFGASAPDGTDVSGILSASVNVLGHPGECVYGGDIMGAEEG